MNGKINICIITDCGVYKIPFATIRQLDMFTVRYKNDSELVKSLIRILRLPINIEEVVDLDIQYVYSDTKLPIKYSGNNYDMDSVIDGYVYYIQTNQRRLGGYGIGNFMQRVEPNFRNISYSEKEIEFFVRRFLSNDYRKIRDAYFFIKNKVKIKIKRVEPRRKHDVSEKYVDGNDSYIDYLLGCLELDEEHYMMAMEELAMMDIETLEKKLGYSKDAVIDGLKYEQYDSCDLDDIHELERLTGLDIGDLVDIVKNQNGFKKRR